jgi:ammonium transporter, Amt family
LLKLTLGLRLDPEQEFQGADLAIHHISATAERESSW